MEEVVNPTKMLHVNSFESLELLLYENLSSSRFGLRQESGLSFSRTSSLSFSGAGYERPSQSRLLCFVVTAIAKLATCHCELLPRARVSSAKVAWSWLSDARVWTRSWDCLGLLNDPAVCTSVLGSLQHPNSKGDKTYPGSVNWRDGGTKMIAHFPSISWPDRKAPRFMILPSQTSCLAMIASDFAGNDIGWLFVFTFN